MKGHMLTILFLTLGCTNPTSIALTMDAAPADTFIASDQAADLSSEPMPLDSAPLPLDATSVEDAPPVLVATMDAPMSAPDVLMSMPDVAPDLAPDVEPEAVKPDAKPDVKPPRPDAPPVPTCSGIMCDPSNVDPGRPSKPATCFAAPVSICWVVPSLGLLYSGLSGTPRNAAFCPLAMRTDGEANPTGSSFAVVKSGDCTEFLNRVLPIYCAEPLNNKAYYTAKRDYDATGKMTSDTHAPGVCP